MLYDYKLFEKIIRVDGSKVTEDPQIASVISGDFLSRYNCMQSWFLRCSWIQKLDVLKRLFNLIKNRSGLPVWASIINETCYDKLLAYVGDKALHDFPYDNMLQDNNRALDENTLKISIENDLEWFKHFNEYFQDGIFLSLCCMAGGSIYTSICKHMTNYYRRHFRNRTSAERVTLLEKSMALVQNVSMHRIEILLPGDLMYQEVQQKRLEWDKKIEKYRREVEGKLHEMEGKGKNKDKKGSKTGKSSKATSKKSSKKGGKKEAASLDYLQLMPIKIVKKILGYLDKKALKKCKEVNFYWTYAVNSLEKELKARKVLDKYIRKLEVNIKEPVINIKIENQHVCRKRNPLKRIAREGTCSKAIRMELNNTRLTFESSLKERAIKDMQESYLVMVNHLKSFPRKEPKESEQYTLYKPPPCIQFEGVRRKRVSFDKIPPAGEITVFKKIEIISPQNSVSISDEEEFDATQYSAVFAPNSKYTF